MPSKIVEIKNLNDVNYWALENGKVGVSYLVDLADSETAPLEDIEAAYSQFLKSLSTEVLFRVNLYSEIGASEVEDHSRAGAINQLGQISNSLIFSFEIQRGSVSSLIKSLLGTVKSKAPFEVVINELQATFDLAVLQGFGINCRSLTENEINALIPKNQNGYMVKTPFGIDHGSHITGVIRLVKAAANPINFLSLSRLKDALPLPYQISLSVSRISAESAELLLRRKTNQATNGSDKIAVTKYLDTQDALEEVALYGGSVFNTEFIVLVPRLDEKSIRLDSESVIQKLKPLGDFAFETFGSLPSFEATIIGSTPHVTSLEVDTVLPSFMPVLTAGDPVSKKKPSKRALALHRHDQSVSYVDLFNPSYDNFSCCIFGKSGRGKSVLTNLLTRSLHHDENVRIIKIDVGGSHSKETALLGGQEYQLTLTQPSGINPFWILGTGETSEDVCNVLATFLNVLLLEEGESMLSKDMRGAIEQGVKQYAESNPKNPSLDDFVNYVKDFPRINLLKRWTGTGIYKNAFKGNADSKTHFKQRLRYYNFSQIFQANDPDFGQGGLAAVMAQFNLELMKSKGKLVFIADETPFFIERCFSFFKFSTANVRKFGGSFVTIAQKSSDVIVGGDVGILENSASKFLYSIDGEKEAFAARMKLDLPTLAKIENLKTVKGQYSDVLFVDQFGSRSLRVQMTEEEYWRVSSSADDNEKLLRLREAIPNLTLEQGIRCLKYA
jgi:hypothetical protein